MIVTPGTKVTEAALDDLAALANAKLLPLVNAAIAANQNAWRTAALWVYDANGVLTNVTGKNWYDIPVAKTAGGHLILNPQPAYNFDLAQKNWHDEINRIRGDLMEMVCPRLAVAPPFAGYAGAGNVFLKAASLVSGPWVVGINDPATWPGAMNGILPGSWSGGDGFPMICLFKNVAFNFFSEDADDTLTVTGVIAVPGQSVTSVISPGLPFTLNYEIDADGPVTMEMRWGFHGPPGAPPAVGGFTTSATPATRPVLPGGDLCVRRGEWRQREYRVYCKQPASRLYV